jgi:amino acid adenylation domain-containing protein
VKVRGFRVEPGEVEAVLARHPAAAEVAVAVRRDGGEPRLVAYAEPAAGAALGAEALAAFARAHLPGYMVPADVVVLGALPRTPGGKVDRQRLPAPAAASSSAASDAPRTAVEEIVAGVWASVLGGGTPGRDDGFFARGGHSLSALQLLARLRDVLGVEVSVRALFEAPTVAGLARAVDEARRGDAPTPPPLVAAADDNHARTSALPHSRTFGSIPLSFAQQRLWLLQQLEPGSAVYNLPLELEIPASLSAEAVDAALTGLVARHAVLRTTFAAGEDGGGVQVIHPPKPFQADQADFTGLPHDARWTAARELAREIVETPVDLGDGPVLRAARVRLDEPADRLLLVMHHAAADGITAGILGEDLAALLDAAAEGRDAVLPALPVQYADYARWQRDWLRGEVEAAQAAWWKTRLAGAPPVSPLPTDRPRPATQSYRGETRTLALPADVADGVRRLSRETSGTVFMTLLAAFKVLLQRWGVGDDVVVGTHVAGRARVETERVAGFFVNALVLRTDLSGTPAFAEVVTRVRETMLGALAHQDLPFERVVEALQPRRDLSVSPLYQLSFDLARVDTPLGDGDEGAEQLLQGAPTTKFDLEVTVEERPDALRVHFGYATDLFDSDTIDRMLGHYGALLAGAVQDASRAAADLPMLGADELRRLTEEFQGPARAYRTNRTLAELFEEQAAATPERIAAVHDGRSVTYAELDRRAGLLARRLAAAGVGRGRFVGILDERGIDFITAVVAVLKAGGAYLPIDPGYPAGRVRHMLADSGVAHLVTRGSIAQAHAEALEAAPALRHVVRLDDAAAWDVDPLSGYPGRPRDPAYMLYTSGSTGLPKGAVIRHDGAVNHVFAQADVLGLGAEWAFLQSAPASSDISVWQMLGPLLVGGRTVVADAETVSDPARLLAVLRDEGITVAELVPAVLRALLAHVGTLPAEARALPALGWMMATGEEVPVDLVNAWLAAYPSTPLTNAYGPTEASDDVTQLVVEHPLPADARAVSIGRPLPNVACHVVDGRMRAAPLGAPGELCVGGIAVGDGYHGKPGRTAAAFIPDPFSATPGATMYRTGDLARWRPDGTLEFLGRIDGQVKVRGFRIETGEVEAALRAHPSVRDCAVVVRDGAAGRHLAAAIVATHGEDASVDVAALRLWLRERLPEPMVPAAFAVLDALPLTPAGKVDRRALAAASFDGAAAADDFVAPRTPTETALAAIWAEVLGMERVGVESDFFALGGHSLLAAMVATRVRAALGVPLPLRRMFEHTTVARLAAHLDTARAGAPAAAARPALARVERSGRRVAGAADGFLKTVQ